MGVTSATGGSATSQADDTRAWQARPVIAWSLRLISLLTPVVASFAASRVYGMIISPETLGRPAFWGGLLVVAVSVAIVVEHRTQQIMPLVALFNMSLVFPDQAPNRFGVALRQGTAKRLKSRADDAGDHEPATDLLVLVKALGKHDPLTRGHSERVRAYSDLIAEELGLSDDDRNKLAWGALAHDVGKLDVRPSTLNKAGRPDDEEWAEIRGHPGAAVDRMAPLASWLGDWTLAASEHHERYDGEGYPLGLRGHEISLAGRIVAVADAYDVMTSARSYKKALSPEAAREELINNAGTQFDPDIVRAFLNAGIRKVRVAGPLAWLSEFAWFVRLPQAATVATPAATTTAATVATTAVSVATVVASPLTPTAVDIPERRDVSAERVVDEVELAPDADAVFEVPIETPETTTTAIVSTTQPVPTTTGGSDIAGAPSSTTMAPNPSTTTSPSTTIGPASTTTIASAVPTTTAPTTTTTTTVAAPATTVTTTTERARATTTTSPEKQEADATLDERRPAATIPDEKLESVAPTDERATATREREQTVEPSTVESSGAARLASTLYLQGRPGGADTFSMLLDAEQSKPLTVDELPNYDSDRDDTPGLLIQKGGGLDDYDPATRHRFAAEIDNVLLAGVPVLDIWVSTTDHNAERTGIVIVSLQDCAASRGDCATIATGLGAFKQAEFGERFGQLQIELTKLEHRLEPGRSLMLNLMVHDASDDDLWFAYGTTTYQSALRFS